MPPRDVYTFDEDAAKRIVRAVRASEAMATDTRRRNIRSIPIPYIVAAELDADLDAYDTTTATEIAWKSGAWTKINTDISLPVRDMFGWAIPSGSKVFLLEYSDAGFIPFAGEC